MSGICGWVGDADPAVLTAMLDAIAYRGDTLDKLVLPGAALGYRFWKGRPGKSAHIHHAGTMHLACAGTLAPPVAMPAEMLLGVLQAGETEFAKLDGAFAAAAWDESTHTLTLLRDPFGVRSLYYVEHGGVFYFASELKQILAIPGLEAAVDPVVLHKYLSFSFVPGQAVPIRNVWRLLPGHLATLRDGRLTTKPYFSLQEEIDPALSDQKTAVRTIRTLTQAAVARRLNGERQVGLYLSGGLDSSSVAVFLKDLGVEVRAYSLDFGARSVEREQAEEVAKTLGIELTLIRVGGADIAPIFFDLVHKLDLPFGDAVTGPQYLLGRAAHKDGLTAVFNGEGGDQLFGGWTSKPMIAASLYSGILDDEESPEESYLRSYHRFYGLEEELYTPDFQAEVGAPGQRRAHLQPYLGASASFLNRVRLADIALKGSQNIVPRAERLANAWALDVRVPLFDRELATTSFKLPPNLKLHGACEKYVFKLAMKRRLPERIVWRKKFGMSVPVTDWTLGPLAELFADLLDERAVRKRGLFRPEYVARLRQGCDEPGEVRKRRIGEKLWALAMLEGWLRVFVDGKGRSPSEALP